MSADETTVADDATGSRADADHQASEELDLALRDALGADPAVADDVLAEVPDAAPEEADDEVPAEVEEPSAPGPIAAPAPTVAPDSADAALVEAVGGGLTWIPFACYLGLWVVLAGLSAYLLYGADTETPARWMPEYLPLLWSGVGLTALGPVLSLVVWIVARARRPKQARRGLFASAMTRGSLIAFFGVAIWIATLFVLELVATGGTL